MVRYLIAFLSLIAPQVVHASCPDDSTSEQCGRVQKILEHWGSKELSAIPIAVVTPPANLNSDGESGVQVDQAKASVAAKAEVGACRFDEADGRVEIEKRAFDFSDAGLAKCLAAAMTQARYDAVEDKWLEHLGESEAWIVRGGKLTRVAVPHENKVARLDAPSARVLWTSFAMRELDRDDGVASESGADRRVASAESDPVRGLLGLKHN